MEDYFIEIDWKQISEQGRAVSGDVCLMKKCEDRTIMVVSDGSGSGIKANVIASVIASMAMNYSLGGEHPGRAAKAIIETFARGDHRNEIEPATFTIVTVLKSGKVEIAEFANPKIVIVRGDEILDVNRIRYTVQLNSGRDISLTVSEFSASCEDRIIVYTDGISQSGQGTRRLPKGWGEDCVRDMICSTIRQNHLISASELAREVVSKAEMNDLNVVKNDMCCASIYFRKPRKVLVTSGPPFDEKMDKFLADTIKDYNGEVIISGGTTAQIVSRELGRDISVIMKRDPSGLPPMSKMEGVTMITEGVLTLAKVRSMLLVLKNSDVTEKGIAAQFVRLLLEHDIIEFLVGSRINAVHQDPNLPIELELRRNVIKEMGRILESKFMKQVTIKYI